MKRRHFFKTTAALTAGTFLNRCTAPRRRPNIMLIFTDQQTYRAMSCTGNTWLKTPAMDRLAKEGVRFDNAYCTSPVCSPARSTLVSGLMPHTTGV
jgi:arylsulfatase A-like enzyme